MSWKEIFTEPLDTKTKGKKEPGNKTSGFMHGFIEGFNEVTEKQGSKVGKHFAESLIDGLTNPMNITFEKQAKSDEKNDQKKNTGLIGRIRKLRRKRKEEKDKKRKTDSQPSYRESEGILLAENKSIKGATNSPQLPEIVNQSEIIDSD